MKNLTPTQEVLINDLTTEFSRINNLNSTSGGHTLININVIKAEQIKYENNRQMALAHDLALAKELQKRILDDCLRLQKELSELELIAHVESARIKIHGKGCNDCDWIFIYYKLTNKPYNNETGFQLKDKIKIFTDKGEGIYQKEFDTIDEIMPFLQKALIVMYKSVEKYKADCAVRVAG